MAFDGVGSNGGCGVGGSVAFAWLVAGPLLAPCCAAAAAAGLSLGGLMWPGCVARTLPLKGPRASALRGLLSCVDVCARGASGGIREGTGCETGSVMGVMSSSNRLSGSRVWANWSS